MGRPALPQPPPAADITQPRTPLSTTHRNGTCTRPLQSRVEVGVSLYEQRSADHLIFSGAHPGEGLRNISEASAMLDYAVSLAGGRTAAGRCVLCCAVLCCAAVLWGIIAANLITALPFYPHAPFPTPQPNHQVVD